MRDIRFCPSCAKHTLKETCDCTLTTVPVFPPKYSPEDKYARYRRTAKETERKARGLI
jgi:H/ACA ribonucleoprotein complex subunit 3